MHLNSEVTIKLSILKKYLPLLAACPYSRAIFLAGSTAAGRATPDSDIDLIIISQNRQLWSNRLFLELATRVMGQRRSRKKFKNCFCFNMFLNNDSPVLPHRDAAAAACYKNLKLVWGEKKELINFGEKNSWIKNFGDPNFEFTERILSETKYSSWVRSFLEKFFELTHSASLLEKISYLIQTVYLKHEFNRRVPDKNSPTYVCQLTPHLINYHFPVSNHWRQLQKSNEYKAKPVVRI